MKVHYVAVATKYVPSRSPEKGARDRKFSHFRREKIGR